MQTFLPYPDFKKTAGCLDRQRLGKQRVEAKQILNAIEKQTGWRNHPIVKMWTSYEEALKAYFNAVSTEWVFRGYKHTMGFFVLENKLILPPWLGDEELHLSHKSNLLRKKPEYYRPIFGSDIPDNLPYKWVK